MFKNSALKNSVALVACFFAAVFLLMLVFLIWPVWQDIARVSRQIISDRATAASMQQQAAAVADFKEQYPAHQAGLENIHAMGVDAANPVQFFKFIEGIATMFQVKAEIRLAPQAEKNASPNTFEILVKESEFANVLKFSHALENGSYAAHIQALDIKTAITVAGGTKFPQTLLDANIIITTMKKPSE